MKYSDERDAALREERIEREAFDAVKAQEKMGEREEVEQYSDVF